MTTYSIKKLPWVRKDDHCWSAADPLTDLTCIYKVWCIEGDWLWSPPGRMDRRPCVSLEQGQKLCQEHFEDRVKPALEQA